MPTLDEAITLLREYVEGRPRKYHKAVELMQDLDESTRAAVLALLPTMQDRFGYYQTLARKFSV